jgi:hypothetical protein
MEVASNRRWKAEIRMIATRVTRVIPAAEKA